MTFQYADDNYPTYLSGNIDSSKFSAVESHLKVNGVENSTGFDLVQVDVCFKGHGKTSGPCADPNAPKLQDGNEIIGGTYTLAGQVIGYNDDPPAEWNCDETKKANNGFYFKCDALPNFSIDTSTLETTHSFAASGAQGMVSAVYKGGGNKFTSLGE